MRAHVSRSGPQGLGLEMVSGISGLRATHRALVMTLASCVPAPLPLFPHAVDLADRRDHVETVLNAFALYLGDVLDETAQNVPGGIERKFIDSLWCDLVSEVLGTLQSAACSQRRRYA